MSQNTKHQFRNFYAHCGQEWHDTWDSQCNDKCPVCNAEIEPHDSEELQTEEETQ